jgi:endonuclease/exonuclease/phosphatase family metal-dependent hydrolase
MKRRLAGRIGRGLAAVLVVLAVAGVSAAQPVRAATTLTVVTYNIKGTVRGTADAQDHLTGWVQAIAGMRPTIIGLQEVCVDDVQTIVDRLQQEYGLTYHMAEGPVSLNPTCPAGLFAGFGQALLSIHPLRDVQNVNYPVGRDRGYLHAHITVDGIDVASYNTHIATEPEVQPAQIARLALTADEESGPVLVMGDFNMAPDSPNLAPIWNAGFQDADENCQRSPTTECKPTFPAGVDPDVLPPSRDKIDFIFQRGFVPSRASVFWTAFTDHLAFRGDVAISID